MSSLNYKVIPIDLSIIRSAPGEPVLPVGVAYDGVIVQSLPVGAVCSIAFGDNKDAIPLTLNGQAFEFLDQCGVPYSVTERLLFTNPIGAGFVQLLVSIGSETGGSVQGGN